MKPREFFQVVVLPDLTDFQKNDTDFRAAYHAVTSADALAAQIYNWCAQNKAGAIIGISNDTHYRHHLAQRDSDFGLLRDIAKAQKHVFLTQGNPQISIADDVSVRELGWDEASWDEAKWDGPPEIVVQTKRGDNRSVLFLVKRALDMLNNEMTRLGVQ